LRFAANVETCSRGVLGEFIGNSSNREGGDDRAK
jgi:hypothetical protein